MAWLSSARLFRVLAGLNLLVTLVLAVASLHAITPDDRSSYMGLAEGMLHGRYSAWYFLPDYIPDTFRNPGYPVFLLLLKSIGLHETGIRLFQTGLYIGTIALVLRLIKHCEGANHTWLVRNLFLLLLLPNIQLAYLAAYIYPEVLVAFMIALYGVVAITWAPSWKRTLTLALVAGVVFQLRPVFVFVPVIQLLLDFWQTRRQGFSWVQAAALLLVFGATMLPYGLWNLRHHGVFKTTSLEGGAGVMQIGFWALRMPGYHEGRYWGNQMGDEVVSFTDTADVKNHIAAFNREWDVIDAQTKPLLTDVDRRYAAQMYHYIPPAWPDYGFLFPTYSSAYTIKREQLLMKANVADILREPGYYFKTRLYTLVRLWVTGVQRPAWRAATSPVAKIKVLYPTLVSGFTFLLAVASIGWVLLSRRRMACAPTWRLSLALVVYFGLIHLPFAIQARYTVPVRPWLLLSIALAVGAWLTRRTQGGTQALMPA
ncbi:hypothetical protein IC234_06685 [Hymenobacter sp. BT189]|uniref:Glycosyltransferase RgtA/B/C/D-like domain-containing protein n=1 Tax=Hymenobacter armeniacus TaxID=2771358 RepID=A0ABR8JT74_9BACT|nr:hypothetical protein [Hymenobacter armeniacus]